MKKAYFIGIAGKTMAPLAKAFKDMGWEVSGSDKENVYPPISTYLEENKISYNRGFSEANVPYNADLVIAGYGPILADAKNPEYLKAKNLGLKVLSYPEVLQKYLIKSNSVVIAGTFGKSTTSLLIAWILIMAKMDPSYMSGGIPMNLKDGLKITESNWSVVEGDEVPALHKTDPPKFMFYKPKYLLITATIFDHPEIYKTEQDYVKAFVKLVRQLPQDGILVYNQDYVDKTVIDSFSGRKISYSLTDKNTDFFVEEFVCREDMTKFSIRTKDEKFQFQTKLIGKHSLENICGAFALCKNLDINKEVIAESIKSYEGVKGRLEFLGKFGNRFLYWDFSQHPLKVKSALEALKDRFPKNQLICVFDPQMTGLKYRQSLAWYPKAFDRADKVIIGKVGFIKENEGKNRVSGSDIVKAVAKTQPSVVYQPDDEKIIKNLFSGTKDGDVIVFMSSGGLRFVQLVERVKESFYRRQVENPPLAGKKRLYNNKVVVQPRRPNTPHLGATTTSFKRI